jgi:hypothetical protein
MRADSAIGAATAEVSTTVHCGQSVIGGVIELLSCVANDDEDDSGQVNTRGL